MKIVQLAKSDLSGGAARAAYRLHKGLQRIGQDSAMLVASRTSDDPSVVAFEKPMRPLSMARRGWRQIWTERQLNRYSSSRPSGYELFSSDRSPFGATLLERIPSCHVINMHWVSGFVDYQAFFTGMSDSVPIVWTFHDLNPLTGGCHYDLGCERFITGCGMCPQLGSSNSKDLSREVWERKYRLFLRLPVSRLRIVAPSKWLAGEIRKSPFLGRFQVDVIPYGLDLDEFAPRDRGKARELLGIPKDARVLLFVAEDVGRTRKGFGLLIDALARCAKEIPNLMLVSLGSSRPNVQTETPWVHLGSVDNDRFLSIVYSVADLFAICSLQDNLPNTVLEAMACGVAVVGHAVGGIPDMVRDGVNGVTTPKGDPDALAHAISTILNDKSQSAQMGANSRRIALEEYPLDLQARRYSELYEAVTQKRASI